MENITYKIKEGQEGITDPRSLIVVKTGHETEISLRDYDTYILQNEKAEKQVQAQLEYEKAIATNIEQNHPFVLQMPQEQLVTVWLYKEAIGKIALAEKKLEEIKVANASLRKEEAAMIVALPELAKVEEVKPQEDEKEATA